MGDRKPKLPKHAAKRPHYTRGSYKDSGGVVQRTAASIRHDQYADSSWLESRGRVRSSAAGKLMAGLRVFCAFPTANPDRARETLHKWREMGYESAVLLNHGDGTDGGAMDAAGADHVIRHVVYDGFYRAGNVLAQWLVSVHKADIVVCANDDIDPDPNKTAQEIAAECVAHFAPSDCWVMQPSGDRQGWMADKRHPEGGTAAADRICGSPWFSAGYIRRGYEGRGPWPTHYVHFSGDCEMDAVALRLGILWRRRDLTHFHRHWSWGHTPKEPYQAKTQTHWNDDERILRQRRESGFPGSALLGAS